MKNYKNWIRWVLFIWVIATFSLEQWALMSFGICIALLLFKCIWVEDVEVETKEYEDDDNSPEVICLEQELKRLVGEANNNCCLPEANKAISDRYKLQIHFCTLS